MTAEFTFYILFILLSITTGVVFQFMLSHIKKVRKDLTKLTATVSKIHTEVNSIKNQPQSKPGRSFERSQSFRRNRVLTGCLELEHQGARAQTNATFYVKEEK